MSSPVSFDTATEAWQYQLGYILKNGEKVSPRGKPTLEVRHPSLQVSMANPAVRVEERGLNYSFMAAEALWMIRGDDTVSGIAPYNPNIEKFSDDGETFFGAYGPKIVDQADYVVDTLLEDRSSRQAVLTIWRENPPESRDIPCTVSMDFQVRNGRLENHVYMRSSDIWLGLPYDMFNFTMVAAWIACQYNERRPTDQPSITLGDLYWTAGSSHLYEDPGWIDFDLSDAEKCVDAESLEDKENWYTPEFPRQLVIGGMDGWRRIRRCLYDARENGSRQEDNIYTPRPLEDVVVPKNE